VSKRIQLPRLGDRVVLAAGEDAHTGSHKLDALLDAITKGEQPALSLQELGTLRDVTPASSSGGLGTTRPTRGWCRANTRTICWRG
jgi:hypothetical protein